MKSMRAICIVCLLLCMGSLYANSGTTNSNKMEGKKTLEERVKNLENKLAKVEVKLDSLTKLNNQKKSDKSSQTQMGSEVPTSQKEKKTEEKDLKSSFLLFLLPALLISLVGYAYYRKNKVKLKREPYPMDSKDVTIDEIKAVDDVKQSIGEGSGHEIGDTKSDDSIRNREKSNVPENTTVVPGVSSDAPQSDIKDSSVTTSWTTLHASQIGASHTAAGLPCQDYSMHKALSSDWGICVVSDGAGSASHSHIGSKMACRIAIRETTEFIRLGKYIEHDKLPESYLWEQAAERIMRIIKRDLNTIAVSLDKEPKEFSTTCMIAVYSPHGLLSTHIGDGRGGYHDKTKGEWLALFSPHKGEEANQTLFVMSAWENLGKLGDVVVPESHVYLGDIDALCLLSDGMEKATYECSVYNEELGRYEDLNRPSSKIFSQFLQVVREAKASGKTDETIQQMWQNYLREGNKTIANEADDKTMLLAVRNH